MFVIISKSATRRGKNAAFYLGSTLASAAVSQSLPRHTLSLPGSRRAPVDPFIIFATEKAPEFSLPPRAVTPIAHTSSKTPVKDVVNHAIVLKNIIDRWNDEGLPQLELDASIELLDRIGRTLAEKNPHLASSIDPESAKDFFALTFISTVANIQNTGNPCLLALLKKVLAYQTRQSTHAAVTPSVPDPAQVTEPPTPILPGEGEDMESAERMVESAEEREDARVMGEAEDSTVYDVDRSVTETPVHGDDAEVGSNKLVIEEALDVEDKSPEELKQETVLTPECGTACQEVNNADAEDDGAEWLSVKKVEATNSTSQSFSSPPLSPVDHVSLPISQPIEPASCTPETPITLPSLTVVELPTSSNGSEDMSQLEVVIENEVTTTMEGDTDDTEAQEEEAIDAADVDPTTSGNGESMESESESGIENLDVQVDSETDGIEHDDDRDKVRRTKNDKWFVVQNGKAIKAAHTSRPSAPHQPVPLPAIWEPNSSNRFAAFEKAPAPAPASKKVGKASKSLQAAATITHKVEEGKESLKASNAPVDNCSPSETSSSELVDVSMPASISATVKDEELPPVTADENEGWSTVKKRRVLKATKTTSPVPEMSTSAIVDPLQLAMKVEASTAKPTMKAKAWLEMLKPQTQPALKWDLSESPWESQVAKTATSAFSYARAAVIAPGPLASSVTSSTPSDTTIPASSPWKDVEPAPSSTSGEAAVATEDDWLSPEDKAKEHEAAAASIPSPRTTTSPTSQPANASSSTTVERNDIEPALSSLKNTGETALASSGMTQTVPGKADTMRKERRDRSAEVARFDSVMQRLKSQLGGKTAQNMTPEVDIRGSKTMCLSAAGPSNHITPSPSLNHDAT